MSPLCRAAARKRSIAQHHSTTTLTTCTSSRTQQLPTNKRLRAEVPECLELPSERQLFPFLRNMPFLHTTIVHFQLRNLLWAASAHDVFAVHRNCIKCYNTVSSECTTVMDLSGQGRGAFNLGEVLVSTMCAGHGLVAAGAPTVLLHAIQMLHVDF